MGQKVNPVGLRLGIVTDWYSKWFSDRDYAAYLHEDLMLRKYLRKRLSRAALSTVEIERKGKSMLLKLHSAKPGVAIGQKGSEVEKIRKEVASLLKTSPKNVLIDIREVKKAEIESQLVADNIASQLEQRASFRRVMKRAISNAMRNGAKGIKVMCSGRLGGAEMARTEMYKEGRIPLHTLRADVDYATATAFTIYGCIGVKVWIFKGEVLQKKQQ